MKINMMSVFSLFLFLLPSIAIISFSHEATDKTFAPKKIHPLNPNSNSTTSTPNTNNVISITPLNAIKASATYPIYYHNGLVMVGTVNIYIVWYGTWTTNQKTIIGDFLTNVGGSSWYGITTLYYQIVNGVKTYVSPSVVYIKSVTDNYSQGTQITNSELIVQNKLNNNALPYDKNGVYFVLSSADVSETFGSASFCSSYCGYHSYIGDIKYSFVGNPHTLCPSSCGDRGISPNGDSGV